MANKRFKCIDLDALQDMLGFFKLLIEDCPENYGRVCTYFKQKELDYSNPCQNCPLNIQSKFNYENKCFITLVKDESTRIFDELKAKNLLNGD